VKKKSSARKSYKRDSGQLLPTPRSQDAKHGNPTEFEFSREKGKDLLHVAIGRPSSQKSETSMERNGEEQLSLPGAFHASLSLLPDSDEAKKMTVTSGRKCLGLLVKRNPIGYLQRMCLESSEWHSTRCLLTWKAKVTPQGHLLFQLVASTPRTEGIESGLLRTPDANMERGSRTKENLENRYLIRKMPLCLNDQLRMMNLGMLRTPSGQEPGIKIERLATKKGESAKIGERAYDKKTGRLAQVGLPQQINMLATPSVMDIRGDIRKPEERSERANKGGCTNLREQIAMLPTPRAGCPGSRPNKKGGKILAEEISKLLPTPNSSDQYQANLKNGHDIKKGYLRGIIAMLPTPQEDDSSNVYPSEKRRETLVKMIDGTSGKKTGMKLQPAFVEWMMGFPIGFTDLKR